MARLLWVLAALAMTSATASTDCMFEGKEYMEPGRTDGIPNGAYSQDPYECQKRCHDQVATIGCVGFTWKESANISKSIGPKGCWLVSYAATLVDTDATGSLGRVVSGPPECTTVTGTTAAPGSTMMGLTTAFPPVAPVAVVTTAPAVVVDTTAIMPGGLNGTNITGGAGADTGGGGIPTWLIILILVAIVGVCIGAVMMQFGGKSKASKKKKKKTRSNDIEAEPAVEVAPLLVEPASPVPASPASPLPAPMPGSPSLPVPSLTAPVLPMPGMAVAAAAPGYMQARQPVAYMQPMYPGAQVYAGGPRQIGGPLR